MKRQRLTLLRIDGFSCPDGKAQAFLWDTEVPRLAVRVTRAGAKSFIFESKLNGKTVRLTIGPTSGWLLDDARAEARRLQTLVDRGEDPPYCQGRKAGGHNSPRSHDGRRLGGLH
jgi:hypothetical protein